MVVWEPGESGAVAQEGRGGVVGGEEGLQVQLGECDVDGGGEVIGLDEEGRIRLDHRYIGLD
ncbi:hypothetical protein APR08_006173 [Nocardia amikacinitolerans]|nr:hypothetical protein [Nocardia amikacinitolerans]